MNESENKDRPINRTLLIALPVLVVVIVAAWQLLGTGKFNLNGTSLMPPIPLSDMVLVNDENQALPASLLKGQWTYIMFAETGCDEACEQQLVLTQKVTAGKTDTQRVLVLAHEPGESFIQRIRSDHPQLVVAVLTRSIWTIFTVQFMSAINEMGGAPYFLVSPNGLVVMGYDELVSVEDVASDLQHLMKK